jgi:lysophospholipase L1-like esterase
MWRQPKHGRGGPLRSCRHRAGVGALALLVSCVVLSTAAPSASAIVVSIGDSFSTGAGAGPLDPGTEPGDGDGCSRSRDAWPRLIGVPAQDHFACAAATIGSLQVAQKSGPLSKPDSISQLDRLRALAATQPVTRVYVTIGINDLGFGPIIASCVLGSCLEHLSEQQYPLLARTIAPETTAVLKLARKAAPAAQIVLVGYPQLFPKRASPHAGCGWLSRGEGLRFRSLQGKLDATLGGAAAAGGAYFISVRGAFRHHELCSARSWVEPVTGKNPHTGRQVLLHQHHGAHPTRPGQGMIAHWVRRAQRDFPDSIRPPPPSPRAG